MATKANTGLHSKEADEASKEEDEDDEFFGDQAADFWGTCENRNRDVDQDDDPNEQQQTRQRYALADGLAEREILAAQEQFRNMGYLEAYDESKEQRLQEGFEQGYKQHFEAAMKLGQRLGQLTSPIVPRDEKDDDNVKLLVQSVRRFLVDLDNSSSEEDNVTSRTQESLAALLDQFEERAVKESLQG